MKETELSLLIDGNVLGKVIQAVIYFFITVEFADQNTPTSKEIDRRFQRSTYDKKTEKERGSSSPWGIDNRGGDEEEEELMEQEEKADVKVLDFDNYNDVLVSEVASQKATCSTMWIFESTGRTTKYNVN